MEFPVTVIIVMCTTGCEHTSGMMHCLLNECPQQSFLAMAQHASQWVWFWKTLCYFFQLYLCQHTKKNQLAMLL